MRAILLPLIVVLVPVLQAASSRAVDCRLVKVTAGGGLDSVLVTSDEGGEITCPLPTGTISDMVRCPVTDGAISFLSGEDKSPLVTATIPAGMKSALLVFMQTKATTEESQGEEVVPLSWRILVVDDSGGKLSKGGGLIVNCNDVEIRYTIGAEEEILPAMTAGFFKMPQDRDDFNMAQVKCELRKGDRWVVTRENSLRFLPDLRYMIFSYPDANSGRPRVSIVKDSK